MSPKIRRSWMKLSPVRLIRWSVQRKFFEGLVAIVSMFTLGLGMTFLLSPEAYANSPSFRSAFSALDPRLWGAALVVGVLGLCATALRPSKREQGVWPGSLLVVTFVGLSIAFLRSVPLGGVPSGFWIYMGFAFVFVWIIAGCAFIEEEVNRAPQKESVAYVS